MTGSTQAKPKALFDNDSDFAILFKLVARMVDAAGWAEIPKGQAWMNDRQTLGKKLVYHLSTIQTIRGGSTIAIGEEVHDFTDHGSLTVVARAVFENYIVFAYLFGSDQLDLCQFRHLCWKYGGMMDRQKLPRITDKAKAKMDQEKVQVDELLGEIQSNVHFENLPTAVKKALVKGKWDGGKQWRELAVEVGLSDSYFRTMYSYLCDYSHASYASALQVGQASAEAQGQLAKQTLGIMNLCMAKFALGHLKCFESGRALIEEVDAREMVKKWDIRSERFDEIYRDGVE